MLSLVSSSLSFSSSPTEPCTYKTKSNWVAVGVNEGGAFYCNGPDYVESCKKVCLATEGCLSFETNKPPMDMLFVADGGAPGNCWIEKVAYEDFDPRLVPAVGTGGCHVFAACSDTHELDSACPTPGSANPMPTECFALPAFPYPPGVDPTVHDDVVEFWAGWNAGGCPSTPASEPFRNLIDETCCFTSPAIIDEQQFVCMRNTTDICMSM